jgi:hypothetical protein
MSSPPSSKKVKHGRLAVNVAPGKIMTLAQLPSRFVACSGKRYAFFSRDDHSIF